MKMNPILELIHNRKSIRVYEQREIDEETTNEILGATMRAPTAGNMMLYSIIRVTDQSIKNTLVRTCDNQPFIAKSPLVLLFLADYQRWYDCFLASGVEELCEEKKIVFRRPEEGDLFLACCDALIAAHTAVLAAESLGVGSCYIGDIMENYEEHRRLFNLPPYVFPIALLCLGYPTPQQKERALTRRFDEKFIVFKDTYKRFKKEDFDEMFGETRKETFGNKKEIEGAKTVGQLMFMRKFNADFSREMSRSVREILRAWREG
jgi:FMN reductase (NADPH)/FMN reductase [NAD(P)H]